MSRWSFTLLLLLLVGIAPVLAPSPTRATGPDSALLRAADLPPGWVVLSEGASAPSSYAWCPPGEALPVLPVARAARSFAGGVPGPLLYHEVLQFAPGDAVRALAAVRARPGPCTWALTEPDLAPMTFHLSALTDVALGDEAVRRELEAEWGDVVVAAEVLIIRQGDIVALLTHVAIGQADVRPDPALTTQWAAKATAWLQCGNEAPQPCWTAGRRH